MTTAVFPGGGGPNTYVPSYEASGKLKISFSRNVSSFKYLEYMHIIPVSQRTGYYLTITAENAARIVSVDEREWPLGEDAPEGKGNTESFKFDLFGTDRRLFPFRIEQEAAALADWDVLAFHGEMAAQQAMTMRTQKAMTMLQTVGSWPAGNTADVATLATGNWDDSTVARQAIKKSIDYGIEQILLGTLASVSTKNMILVLSPTAARKIAASQEIADYVKGSQYSLPRLMGKDEFGSSSSAQMGLPDYLYGVKVVVEDAVRVTSRKGGTLARTFVMDSDSALLLSRPGGVEGVKDSNKRANFSTVTAFMYEEMTVESKHDIDNRVHKGRVVEDYDHVMTAPASGFLFQNILA